MHDWKSCFSTNILLVDTRVITFGNVSRKKLVIDRASDDACDDGMWHAVCAADVDVAWRMGIRRYHSFLIPALVSHHDVIVTPFFIRDVQYFS
jgi:hypothetical protein